MIPVLAAFDISGITGVAWGTDQHRAPVPAVWKLPEDNQDRALCVLRQQAMALFQATKATHVVIEKTMAKIDRFRSADTLIALKSLEAVVREAATRHGLQAPIVYLAPQSWRSIFLGKGCGNLPRAEAKAAAMSRCDQLRWNYLGDDNAAEACALWYCAATRLWPHWRP